MSDYLATGDRERKEYLVEVVRYSRRFIYQSAVRIRVEGLRKTAVGRPDVDRRCVCRDFENHVRRSSTPDLIELSCDSKAERRSAYGLWVHAAPFRVIGHLRGSFREVKTLPTY
jgi:hypothetical protein